MAKCQTFQTMEYNNGITCKQSKRHPCPNPKQGPYMSSIKIDLLGGRTAVSKNVIGLNHPREDSQFLLAVHSPATCTVKLCCLCMKAYKAQHAPNPAQLH